MKFVSKIANLNIILRPGIPAQPLTGAPEVPTLYVRFKDGVANITDENLIELMLKHQSRDSDFIVIEENERDPFAHLRAPSEPAHSISEIEHGAVKQRTETPVAPVQLPPQILEMINNQAKQIAEQMLPGMVAKVLESYQPKHEVSEDAPVAGETKETTETAAKNKQKTK